MLKPSGSLLTSVAWPLPLLPPLAVWPLAVLVPLVVLAPEPLWRLLEVGGTSPENSGVLAPAAWALPWLRVGWLGLLPVDEDAVAGGAGEAGELAAGLTALALWLGRGG